MMLPLIRKDVDDARHFLLLPLSRAPAADVYAAAIDDCRVDYVSSLREDAIALFSFMRPCRF